MKILGFYDELWPYATGTDGSIKAHTSTSREPDTDRVRQYLDTGDLILAIMSNDPDVMGGDRQIFNGSSIRTDGEYLWRQDLGHYYDNYDLRLPAAFLAQVRELDYQVPEVSDGQAAEVDALVTPLLNP
ncbi:hypothetical protein [Actinosynnema sp. NPDC020468]|uniref:hypothetical protein n=1 Tax=Actinosynnema sp. NPDC020468 TaxID=3154488 RepID=UPI0033F26DFE